MGALGPTRVAKNVLLHPEDRTSRALKHSPIPLDCSPQWRFSRSGRMSWLSQVSLYKPGSEQQLRNENSTDLDSGCLLARNDQFSDWWLALQSLFFKKAKSSFMHWGGPHFASTNGLNDWLSDAVEAKRLLAVNWSRKLHWLKPCFQEDQERHEQLESFRKQLRRRSSPSNQSLLFVYSIRFITERTTLSMSICNILLQLIILELQLLCVG